MDPRTYLVDRFRADHEALVQRAAQLRAVTTHAPRPAGPDAATSQQMADACETVVRMLSDIGSDASPPIQITALLSLVSRLEQLGGQAQLAAPVRSVYVGAATRIREVGAAESAAALTAAAHDDDNIDENGDENGDDELDRDVDDDDFDDQDGVGGPI